MHCEPLHGSGKLNESKFLRKNQKLRIAGVRFVISKDPAVRLRVENSLYLPFFFAGSENKNNAKIDVRLRFDCFPPVDHLKKVFATEESWAMYREAKNFWIAMAPPCFAEPLWIARFDRLANRVDVFCRSVSPGPANRKKGLELPIVYPLDQLLLMHFLAVRRGILVHAAGMVRNGEAFVFTGASGAGKSTFSELLAGGETGKLLSDERMIVREIDGAMLAFGTPWAGTAGIAGNGHAPLAGIYFLKHGRSNHIEKMAVREALDKILPLISIPWYDPGTAAKIVAFAERLLAKIPAFEMSFRPDRSAVDFFLEFQKTK
jgi:hypothetical protein